MILPSDFNPRWQIPFIALNGVEYTINIYDKWEGTPTILKGGSNPFVIDEDDDDDIIKGIRTQTGTIAFIDDGTIVSEMLSDTPINRPVILFNGEVQEWCGFLSCESMSQPYADYIHEVSVNIMCPLAALQGIEIAQPADNLGFVTLNALVHEALRKVYIDDLMIQEEDWGAWPWNLSVVRYYWLTLVYIESTIQKPYYGSSYYDILSEIFSYTGRTIYMQRDGAVERVFTDKEYTEGPTPEWMATDHMQDFMAGVNKVVIECRPDDADTNICGIPEDESHVYDLGPMQGVKHHSDDTRTETYEAWCPTGLADDNWYAWSEAIGPLPPIYNQLQSTSADPVILGGVFENFGAVTYKFNPGETTPKPQESKGMIFAKRGASQTFYAFHFKSITPFAFFDGTNTVRISMKGVFLENTYLTPTEDIGTGYTIPIHFQIKFNNKYYRRSTSSDQTSEGYVWDTAPSQYVAYINQKGVLCQDILNYAADMEDIVVHMPNEVGQLSIDIMSPELPNNGAYYYYFANSFSVDVDVDDFPRRPHHMRHLFDNAFANKCEVYPHLGCNKTQSKYTVGHLFHKTNKGIYTAINDQYETESFQYLVDYYSKSRHMLTITVSLEDYDVNKYITIEDKKYLILSRSYDYRNSTIKLKLINYD